MAVVQSFVTIVAIIGEVRPSVQPWWGLVLGFIALVLAATSALSKATTA